VPVEDKRHAGKGARDYRPGQPVLPPEDDALPGFAKAKPVKGKTRFSGGIRKRWKDPNDGTIHEWDYQYGRVEGFTARGEHLGEFDPRTGQQTKGADLRKRVEP